MLNIPHQTDLAVQKALHQIAFIERSYDLTVFNGNGRREAIQHDLAVMLHFGDLKRITLELLDADSTALFQFAVRFNDVDHGNWRHDAATGVELPILDRRKVVGHRLLIKHNGGASKYQHHLKLSWGKADTLPSKATEVYKSEHARRITGGRQNGEFHVCSDARHRLVVVRAGTKDFAFAEDLDLSEAQVHLHRKFAAEELRFRLGDQLTGLVVQTPLGLQARNIRRA